MSQVLETEAAGEDAVPSRLPRAAPMLMNEHPLVVAGHRRGSLLNLAPGIVGVALVPFWVAWNGFALLDLVLFVAMYWLTLGVGLNVGYHRHFSHGAFETSRGMRWLLAVLGSMAAQGPVIYWAALHRRHHAKSDVEGDPHSPAPRSPGLRESVRSFWHGYYGWSLGSGVPNSMHYCPDLIREPYLAAVSRQYRWWMMAGLLLPAAIGGLVAWSWQGAVGGLLWGGLVRLFLSTQMVGVLNSVGHRFGSRSFETNDRSTNNGWWALPLMGELWHNNHHAFPTSAAHGLRWWQLDLSWLFIRLLRALGLVWNVRLAPAWARSGEPRS